MFDYQNHKVVSSSGYKTNITIKCKCGAKFGPSDTAEYEFDKHVGCILGGKDHIHEWDYPKRFGVDLIFTGVRCKECRALRISNEVQSRCWLIWETNGKSTQLRGVFTDEKDIEWNVG